MVLKAMKSIQEFTRPFVDFANKKVLKPVYDALPPHLAYNFVLLPAEQFICPIFEFCIEGIMDRVVKVRGSKQLVFRLESDEFVSIRQQLKKLCKTTIWKTAHS